MDSQSTSIEKIKEIIKKENEKKEIEMKIREDKMKNEKKIEMKKNELLKENTNEEPIRTIKIEKKDDFIKLGFFALIIYLVLSTNQVEDILFTFFGDEQKSMMPFIKIAISAIIVYFGKNYIE